MGVRLERITAHISYPLTTKRIELPTTTIEPGTVAAVDGTRLDLSVTSRNDIFGLDDQLVGAKLTAAVQLINTIPAVMGAVPGILLTGAFAFPSADLRDVADPPRRAPVPVPVEML